VGFKIGNEISTAGATQVAEGLKMNSTLTSIELSGERITIAEAARMFSIMRVVFKIENDIDDAGATQIAEALKVNTTLTSIDLSSELLLKLRQQDVFTYVRVLK